MAGWKAGQQRTGYRAAAGVPSIHGSTKHVWRRELQLVDRGERGNRRQISVFSEGEVYWPGKELGGQPPYVAYSIRKGMARKA